jgi:hypothetical protein
VRVFYPGGGRRFMLHWWTYDERGHLVLAPTESGLQAVAARVFQKHPDAEIKAFAEIDIVGPSAHHCALAELHDARDRIATFHHELVWRLREAVTAGRDLPAPFAVCTNYEPEEEDEGVGDEAWARETHNGCRHCKERIRLVGLTPSDLYAQYHAAWYAANPSRAHEDRRLVPSRAPAADNHEPLWYASADFGHHSGGVVLHEAKLDEAEVYRPSCLSDRVMFFFRRLRDLDSSAMQKALDDASATRKRRHEARERERVEEHEREERRRIDSTLGFFTDATKGTLS